MHLDFASLHLGRGHAPYTAKNKDGLPRDGTWLPYSFPLRYKISHAPRFRFASSRSRAAPYTAKTKTDFLVQARGFRLCFCCAWLILFRISCRRHLQDLGRCKHFHSGSDQDVHNKSECPDVLYAVSQDLPALR